MAVDAFLQFTKKGTAIEVAGETQDKTFKSPPGGGPAAFELIKWSFGASNTATISSATGGAGAGKAEFDAFSITKPVDQATPYLFQTACVGGHYDQVTLWLRKSGGSQTDAGKPYVQWTFKMMFIEKMSWSSGDDQPTEDIQFRYGAIQFVYTPQDTQGQLLPANAKTTSWSQVLNDDEFAVKAGG